MSWMTTMRREHRGICMNDFELFDTEVDAIVCEQCVYYADDAGEPKPFCEIEHNSYLYATDQDRGFGQCNKKVKVRSG